MLTWAYPWVFWFLPLPLIARRLLPPYLERRAAVRVPFFEMLTAASSTTPSTGATVRRPSISASVMYILCWAGCLIALARPQWLDRRIERTIPTRDLLLLIDLSGSMETEDFVNAAGKQVTRLAAVKEVIDEFIDRRQGDRVGMIVFGSGAFVQVPFTEDLDVCRELLAQTAPRMAGPKTALGDAIGLGITLFERSEVSDRLMIALTDGNDTGSRVPPAEAASIAADHDLVIHTIAVGDPTAVGEEEIDERALQDIAKETDGRFFRADDRDELADIYDEIDGLDVREIETVSHRPRRDLFQWPLAAVFLISILFHAGQAVRSVFPSRTPDSPEEDIL